MSFNGRKWGILVPIRRDHSCWVNVNEMFEGSFTDVYI